MKDKHEFVRRPEPSKLRKRNELQTPKHTV